MSFDVAFNPEPTSIGNLELRLESHIYWNEQTQSEEEEKGGYYRFIIRDQDGDQMEIRKGSLLPHLSQDQIDGLVALLDWARTEAEATLPST